MTQDLSLVTGGGSGLGRALALELAACGHRVIITGRRSTPLEEVAQEAEPGTILPVVADISDAEGRQRLVAVVSAQGGQLRHLVHNAGVIEPIRPLAEVTPDDWQHNQAINVAGPLFLTQALLPALQNGGRVLHISSGAAHSPIPGWGAYCAAKAALHMLYQCLDEELRDRGVRVGSLRPGVVDTPMQARIRESSRQDFPLVERFRAMHRDGALRPAEEVARFARWVLQDTDDDRYAATEWNISDEAHTQAWKTAQQR